MKKIYFLIFVLTFILSLTSLIIAQVSATNGTPGSTSPGTPGSTSTGASGSASNGTPGSTSPGTPVSTSTEASESTSNGTPGSTSPGTPGITTTEGPTTTTPAPNCYNGGLYIDNSKCLCQGLFEGDKCETLKCVSGGYLDTKTNRCICPKGYIGYHCEGYIKHPKPENIFTSSQSTFNVYIFEDSTAYYGKMGLKIFKEVMINHVINNTNNYNNYLVGYDYSTTSTSAFASSTFGNSNDFINFINTTILPQQPKSYLCYTVGMYQNIINLIKSNKIENSPLVIYTQHPPSDYDIYKDELEELVVAFKIRVTILFQNDLLLDGCDESEVEVKNSFSAFRDLAYLSGGIFYQLNSDDPQSGIQHSFDILYNPQMVSFSMNDNCSPGVSLNYQSDLFVSSAHLIIESDTPIDMTKQINPLFNIISHSYDNKTITLSTNNLSPTGQGKNTLNIQNIQGSCSIQFLTSYPTQQSQQGIDVYYSIIPSSIINKDGKDSGYISMLDNTQNYINFNVQKQKILQQYSFSPDKNDFNVTLGSFVTQNSDANFINIVNRGNTIFGYTLGDTSNSFKCSVNKRSWFIVVVEISFPGKIFYYQRYLPIKCYIPMTPTTTTPSDVTTLSTQSVISSTISSVSSTSQQTSSSPTTPAPLQRSVTFGLVASCGVDYSVAMPYLNGIASLTQTNLSNTFYNNGYLYFADSSDTTPTSNYYSTFSTFIDNVRSFTSHCKMTQGTSYVDMIQEALNMLKDDRFQKNSPLVLLPFTGQVITINSQKLIRPLIEYAVAKRVSIYVLAQYNSKYFKSIDIFTQLVKATNGHMFFLNHNLRQPDTSYFAQNTITDFFTNIYPNTLIQSRSITNDYGVDNYGKITITEPKNIIVSVSSDALSGSPTNGYMLNVKMINSNGSIIKNSLTSFNNSNNSDQSSNYEYVIFKNLPPETYTISLQALIYPLTQISVRIWEGVDIYNNYNFIDLSYLSISNKLISSEIPNGPNSDNGIVIRTDISIDGDVNEISGVTCDINQLTSGVASNDILMSPINSINSGVIEVMSPTVIRVTFNPIIDLSSTDSSYFDNSIYNWPIYKGDINVFFTNKSQQTYTFNLFVQGDYKDFVPNINYQSLTQGKNDQFYYCSNDGLLNYDIISNGYKCKCGSENYSGNSCEVVSQCSDKTNYPGKDDDKYRIFTIVLASINSANSFYQSTMDLVNKFTLSDVSNLWQFRLYYFDNNKNLTPYYIGNDLGSFKESFKSVLQQNSPSNYICISDVKNNLYKYLPSGVKGLIWLVTDEGISLPTSTPMPTVPSTSPSSSSTQTPPIDNNCPDDITSGYNQDLFYIYHDNSVDDYLKNSGKLIFNAGGPLKFDNPTDYLDISYVLLQKLFSGDISTNNHLEELTANFAVSIEESREAFVLVLGEIDSQLTNPTTSIKTSKFVSLYTVKDKDSLQSSSTNDLSFVTTYVINGYNVDVAYLMDNLSDEPSSVPGIGNLTYALYPQSSIQDIDFIQDTTNTYKTERNGCSYKYSFIQQTSSNTQNQLQFTFKNINNETYKKVYPNNQVYTSFTTLTNNLNLPITCRNGEFLSDSSTINLSYCVCDKNFRGTDCSIPKCQNGGKLSGMQNTCDCSGTNYYGEFCDQIVSH
uniref:EGF-like domain-containing protein n=1 Tax=Strongyloides papillosus TaxID=174720 RepID=A0A0N5BJG4_STREA